jgi:hypothetical protein
MPPSIVSDETTNEFPECDQFVGQNRCICRGEQPGMAIDGPDGVNAARNRWGLPPISPMARKSSLPPLLIRGWNFANALARWTRAGMPRRTKAEITARLAICQACPYLVNRHCTKCGCACVEQNRLMNKLALATESCPEGKWK